MKKKKTAKTKKPTYRLVNLKVTDKERRLLEIQAQKYTRGNLSAWLRYAGVHLKLSKPVYI